MCFSLCVFLRCQPAFEDATFGRTFRASSQCGQAPSMNCVDCECDAANKKLCFICDKNQINRTHPVTYLNDVESSSGPTCWVSKLRDRKVNLTLSLDKRYEFTYVTVEFCRGSQIPDPLIVWKSFDFGRTWDVLKYFSKDCSAFQSGGLFEKFISQSDKKSIGKPEKWNRKQSSDNFNTNRQKTLQEKNARKVGTHTCTNTHTHARTHIHAHKQTKLCQSDLGKLNETHFFAISNVVLGARCKCNGHASECAPKEEILNQEGGGLVRDHQTFSENSKKRLRCKCRHNTRGPDCNECKSLYNDRPWARGTTKNPNECLACNCNQHTNHCRFNAKLFKLSKNQSGGVCVRCRHNTIGRYCHICSDGYYRNPDEPLDSARACIPCNCNPIGSHSHVCNRTSGQCECKKGVEGQTCNTCASGFQQGSSPSRPCVG
ncbi:hypothetical protein HELRODRAFT_80450 [Helobdella robusta]|uniref:Laminin N-terminal domain-containing protein n=1 Tax=Helobdella robusta TaxID=6412 RepID=T1G408_HELRO|nr:hypothetical protein HELRODRAFT_80450 [Helobdella robusta]ESO03278.1 hypothetical protein HELRODRAFT_80450 [Helobdella robusta]